MERAYGEWSSPVTAETVAGDTLSFGGLAVADGVTYWLERRPAEDGRGVIVRSPPADESAAASESAATDETGSDTPPRADVTPEGTDVRTLAHRYGGGAFAVDDFLVYSRVADGRVCRLPRDGSGEPTPLTPEPSDEPVWYADLTIGPAGDVFAVRQRPAGDADDAESGNGGDTSDADGASDATDEPINELVRIPAAGGEVTVLASGHDFYSFPRPSPDGNRIAWTTWDHPQMPWDGTELHVGRLASEGVHDERVVLGGPDESVFHPEWHDDALYAVSDWTDWWNIYRVPTDGSDPEPVVQEAAEYGVPQWVFGLSTYAFVDDRIATIRTADGEQRVGWIDPAAEEPTFESAGLPYTVHDYAHLVTDGETLACHAGGPATPRRVIRFRPGAEPTTLRRSAEFDFDEAYFAEPTHFAFPTGDRGRDRAYAYYYPPTNPEYEAPAGDHPPAVVTVHGGPTSRTNPLADPGTAFFTSRGFAVIDVNYRGSTGYGRPYRDALDGEWGIRDTADCVNVAHYLGEWGVVDPDRLAIRGGSAGGYAVLSALAFADTFDAGSSYYGVADLRALAEHTHKFESRYLDGLVGPLPEAADTYEARSPAVHADRVSAPTLLLQGGEDRVVPPEQADRMVEELVAQETPYDYVLFPDERHGFESAEASRLALETELGFYATVFGLDRDATDVSLARGEFRRRTPTDTTEAADTSDVADTTDADD